MAKVLRCGELMPDCDTVIEGRDTEEAMQKAAAHAKADHNMPSIPPEVFEKIRNAIRDR
jgi:predicted small metal-binding protein